MSPREQAQQKLVDYLESQPRYNAPYGVIAGLDAVKNGKGKVRNVTFGMARWLDATASIWSDKRITVRAAGPQSYDLDGRTFDSMDALINVLKEKVK